MKTFTNIPKQRLIEELEKHAAADAFVQGTYWEDGKGCAVGCTLHSFGEKTNDHAAFERLFGIPEELARLEDRIFEGLTVEESKEWPLRFSNAVPEGVDLAPVATNFKIRLLEECLVFDREKYPDVDKAVHQVIHALKGNGSLSAARSAAESAAESAAAWSAAWSAAESAAWSKIATILIEELEKVSK